MDVEAQIAVARLIVKIEAAIAQMKVDPRVESVVDRADDLPIGVRADANPPDIAIGGQAEPVAKVVVIATADQRITPTRAAVHALPRKEAGIERQIGGEGPSAKAEAEIGELRRLVEQAVEHKAGDVVWETPTKQAEQNLSSEPFEAVTVEVKK